MTSHLLSPNSRKYSVGDLTRRGTVQCLSLKSERDRKKTLRYLEIRQLAESIIRERKIAQMNPGLGEDHTESNGGEAHQVDRRTHHEPAEPPMTMKELVVDEIIDQPRMKRVKHAGGIS
jgi:hypothetical protein